MTAVYLGIYASHLSGREEIDGCNLGERNKFVGGLPEERETKKVKYTGTGTYL